MSHNVLDVSLLVRTPPVFFSPKSYSCIYYIRYKISHGPITRISGNRKVAIVKYQQTNKKIVKYQSRLNRTPPTPNFLTKSEAILPYPRVRGMLINHPNIARRGKGTCNRNNRPLGSAHMDALCEFQLPRVEFCLVRDGSFQEEIRIS